METLLIFFIAFRFIAAAGGLYFSLKIASMSVTPTGTWILFAIGWFVWLVKDLAGYVFGYQSIVGDALVALFFFAATVRVYYDLKGKFKGLL